MGQAFDVFAASLADVVLDESSEIGDSAPHERTDLAVPRDDFAELSVRTAVLKRHCGELSSGQPSEALAQEPVNGDAQCPDDVSQPSEIASKSGPDEPASVSASSRFASADVNAVFFENYDGSTPPSYEAGELKVAARHSREKCMRCGKPPTHDAIWAEGRARAWFCDDCFESWEEKDDVSREHQVDGEVPKEFSDRSASVHEDWHEGFSVVAAPSGDKVFVENTTGWRGWVSKKTLQKNPGKYKTVSSDSSKPSPHVPKGHPHPTQQEHTHPVDALLNHEPPKPADVHADDLPDPITAPLASALLPEFSDLTLTGPGAAVDKDGRQYRFSASIPPGVKHKAFVAMASSNLASMCLPAGMYLPFKVVQTPEGTTGMIYPVITTASLDTGKLLELSHEQCGQMLAHAAVDWLLGRYTTTPDSMGVDASGNLFPTGYSNTLSGLLDDSNAEPVLSNLSPVFQIMLNNFATGQTALDLKDLGPFIDHIEKIPDSKWVEQVKLASNAMPLSDQARQQIITKALERKHSLRSDFEAIFSQVLVDKGVPPEQTAFHFDAPTVEAIESPATSDPSKPGVLPPVDVELPSKKLPGPDLLQDSGSASFMGGAKQDKRVLSDKEGNKYLFKPNNLARVSVQQAVGDLSGLIAPEGEYVPCAIMEFQGKLGSMQPIMKDVAGDGKSSKLQSAFQPENLTPQQKKDVQREAVVDWAFSNHDGHKGNVLLLNNGRMLGIDKEQAFRYMIQEPDKERLSTEYSPNTEYYGELEPFKNTVYRAFSEGKIDLDLNETLPYIQQLENVSDAKWSEAVAPYVDAMVKGKSWTPQQRTQLMDRILARKNGTREDFRKFFSELQSKRTGAPATFIFSDESAPGVKKAPAVESAPAAVVPSEAAPGQMPVEGKEPTGKCPKGHNTYQVPVPAKCPTCGLSMQPAAKPAFPQTSTGYSAPVVAFDKSPKEGVVINGVPLKSALDKSGFWESTPDKPLQEPPLPKKPGKKLASGLIVVEPDGRVWVVEPTNHFGGYEHTFPKGKQEPALTTQQNALKECFEEAGLMAEVTGYLNDAEGDTSITRYYVAKRTGGAPWDAHWESQAVKLLTLDEAANHLNVPRDKATLELLKQHLQAQPKDVAPGDATAPVNIEPGEVQEAKEPTAVCTKGHKTYQTPPPAYCNQCGMPLANVGLSKSLGIEDKMNAVVLEASQVGLELHPDVVAKALQYLQAEGSFTSTSLGDALGVDDKYKPLLDELARNLVTKGILATSKADFSVLHVAPNTMLPAKPEAAPSPAPVVQKPEVAPVAKPDVVAPTEKQDLSQQTGAEPAAPATPSTTAEPSFVHKPMSDAEIAVLAKASKIKALSPVYRGLEVLNKSPHPLTAKDIVAALTEKHEHTKNMLTTALDKLAAQGKVKKLTSPDGQVHYFVGDVEGVENAAEQGPKQPDEVAKPLHDHLRNLGIKPNLCADIANTLTAIGAGGKEFTPKEFVQHVVANGDPAVGWYGPYALNWIKVMLPKKGLVTLTPEGKCKVNAFPETPTGQCPKGHNTFLKPAPDHCPTCGTPMAPGSEAEVSAPEPVVKAEPAAEPPITPTVEDVLHQMQSIGLEPQVEPDVSVPPQAAPAPVPVAQQPAELFSSVGLPKLVTDNLHGKEAELLDLLNGLASYMPAKRDFFVHRFMTQLPGGMDIEAAHMLFNELVKSESIQVVGPAYAGGETTYKAAKTWAANLIYGKNTVDEHLADKLAQFANAVLTEKPNANHKGIANVGRAALQAIAMLCTRSELDASTVDTTVGNMLSDLGPGANSDYARKLSIEMLTKIGVLTANADTKTYQNNLFSDLTPLQSPALPTTFDANPPIEAPEKAPDTDLLPQVAPTEETPTGEPEDEATIQGAPHPTIPLDEHMAKVENVCARLHLNDDERSKLETALAGLYGQSGGLSKQMTREYFQEAMGLKSIPFGWTAAVNTVDYLAQAGLLQESPEGYTPNIATPTGECKNHHHTYKKPVPTHCPTCGTLMSPIEVMQPEGEADSPTFVTSSIAQKVAITEALKNAGLQVTSKMKDAIKETLYDLPSASTFSDTQFLEALMSHAPYLQSDDAASLALALCKHGILVSQDDGSFKFGSATPKVQFESAALDIKLQSLGFLTATNSKLTNVLQLIKHYHGDKPVAATTVLDEIETHTALSSHDVEFYANKLEAAGILKLSKSVDGSELWTLNFDVHDASENEPIKKLPDGASLDDALETAYFSDAKLKMLKPFLINLKKEYGATVGAPWLHDLMASNGIYSSDIQELVDTGIVSFSDDDQVYELKYNVESKSEPKDYSPGQEGLAAVLSTAGMQDKAAQAKVQAVLAAVKQQYASGISGLALMTKLNDALSESAVTPGQVMNALVYAGYMTKTVPASGGSTVYKLNYGGDIPDKGVPGTLKSELAHVIEPFTSTYGDKLLDAVEGALANMTFVGAALDLPSFKETLAMNISPVLTGQWKDAGQGVAEALSYELQSAGVISVDPHSYNVSVAHLVSAPTAKCKNGHSTYLTPVPKKCTTCGCSMQSGYETGAAEAPAVEKKTEKPVLNEAKAKAALFHLGPGVVSQILEAIDKEVAQYGDTIDVLNLATATNASVGFMQSVMADLAGNGLLTEVGPHSYKIVASSIDFSGFKSVMQVKGIPDSVTSAATKLYSGLNDQAEYSIQYLEDALKEAGVNESQAMKVLTSLTTLGFLKDIENTDKYQVTKPAAASTEKTPAPVESPADVVAPSLLPSLVEPHPVTTSPPMGSDMEDHSKQYGHHVFDLLQTHPLMDAWAKAYPGLLQEIGKSHAHRMEDWNKRESQSHILKELSALGLAADDAAKFFKVLQAVGAWKEDGYYYENGGKVPGYAIVDMSSMVTGTCPSGHKTYVDPKPKYCPTCGKPFVKGEAVPSAVIMPHQVYAKITANPVLDAQAKKVGQHLTTLADMNDVFSISAIKKALEAAGLGSYSGYGEASPVLEMATKLVHAGILTKVSADKFEVAPLATQPQVGEPYTKSAYDQGLLKPIVKPATPSEIAEALAKTEAGGPKTMPSKALAFVMQSNKPLTVSEVLMFVGGGSAPSTVAKNKVLKILNAAKALGFIQYQGTDKLVFHGGWEKEPGLEDVPEASEEMKAAPLADLLTGIDPNMLTKKPKLQLALEDSINYLAKNAFTYSSAEWHDMLKSKGGVMAGPERMAITKALVAAGKIKITKASDGSLRFGADTVLSNYDVKTPHPAVHHAVLAGIKETYNINLSSFSSDQLEAVTKAVASVLLQAKSTPLSTENFKDKAGVKIAEAVGLSSYKARDVAGNILAALKNANSVDTSNYNADDGTYQVRVRIDPGLAAVTTPGQASPPHDQWEDADKQLADAGFDAPVRSTIIAAFKTLQDGAQIEVAALDEILQAAGAPTVWKVYSSLVKAGILEDVPASQDFIVHMPKPVESMGKDEAWDSLMSPTGTCPSGHKTYKAPAPLYCPTCGKKMQQAAGVPDDVSTYDPIINDTGVMGVIATPMPTKEALIGLLQHLIGYGLSEKGVETGVQELVDAINPTGYSFQSELSLVANKVAEELVKSGVLIKNFTGAYVHGVPKMLDGETQLVPYDATAAANGEIVPWVLPSDSHVLFEKIIEAHGSTALVQQSVKAAKVMSLVLKNNSNAGISLSQLPDTGEMNLSDDWMLPALAQAGLLKQFTSTTTGEAKYFIGGWKKVTSLSETVKALPTSNAAITSVKGALLAKGLDDDIVEKVNKVIDDYGFDWGQPGIAPAFALSMLQKDLAEAGLTTSQMLSAFVALKDAGYLKEAVGGHYLLTQPNIPPCSAPKGSTVPFNLGDYNAGKILAIAEKCDVAAMEKVIDQYKPSETTKLLTVLPMLAKQGGTFTLNDVQNAVAGGIPAAKIFMDDLVEAGTMQSFKFTDADSNVITKYFFGHWEKVVDGPLALPAEAKTPTGLCKNGHKTYVTPKPHNCPTCGVVLDTLESGLKAALLTDASVGGEGYAEQIVQYTLKSALAGTLSAAQLAKDLGFSLGFSKKVLLKMTEVGVLQQVGGPGGFPTYTIIESKPMVLTQAPTGVTVASTASTPHGDIATPPKAIYDDALAGAGVIKPVITEFDQDVLQESGAFSGIPFDATIVDVLKSLAEHQKKSCKPITGNDLTKLMSDEGWNLPVSHILAALAAASGAGVVAQQGSDLNTATFVHGYWTPSSAAPAASLDETVETKSNLPTSKSFDAIVAPHFDKQTAKFLSEFLMTNNGQTMSNLDVGQAMIDAGMSGGQAGTALKKLHQLGFVTGIDGPNITFSYPDKEHDVDIAALGSVVGDVISSSSSGHEMSYPVWLALRELQQDKGLTSYSTVCSKLQEKLNIGSNLAYEVADKLKIAGYLLANEGSDGITVLMPSVAKSLMSVSKQIDKIMPLLKEEFTTEKWDHHPTGLANRVAEALQKYSSENQTFGIGNFAGELGLSISEATDVAHALVNLSLLNKTEKEGFGMSYAPAKMAQVPTGKCDNGHNTYLAPLPAHCPSCGTPMNHEVSSGKLNLQPELQGEQYATPGAFAKVLMQNMLLSDTNANAFGQQLYNLTTEKPDGVTAADVMTAFNKAYASLEGAAAPYSAQQGVVQQLISKGMLHEFLPGQYELLLGPPQKSPDKPLTASDVKATQYDVQDETAKLIEGLGYSVTKWDSAHAKKKYTNYKNLSTKVRVYFGGEVKGKHPYFIEVEPDGSLNMGSLSLSMQGEIQEQLNKGLQNYFKSKLVQTVKPKLQSTPLKVAPVQAPAENAPVAPMQVQTTHVTDTHGTVPKEFLETPSLSTAPLELTLPLISGGPLAVEKKVVPKEVPKGPKIFSYSSQEASSKYSSWTAGGKGQAVAKAMEAAGATGMTFEEIMAATPNFIADEEKKKTWADTSLKTILNAGKGAKCIYEVPGSSPTRYALGMIEEPESVKLAPATAALPTKPPDSFIPHDAPHGSDHRSYYAAARLGFNLHDAVQRAAWEASPYYELVQGLAVNPRTGHSLGLSGVSKETMRMLVERGIVTQASLSAWNESAFLKSTFKLASVTVALDKPMLLPPPSVVEFGANGKVSQVHVSAAMEDAITGVLGSKFSGNNVTKASLLLKYMASDPGRMWSEKDMATHVDASMRAELKNQRILLGEGDAYRINWPLMISATNDQTKPLCPKCNVRHRDSHLCPKRTPMPKTGVPSKVPEVGVYSVPVADVSVTPLTTTVTVANNDSELPITIEQATSLLKEQGIAVKKGSKMAHLVELLHNPMNSADISVAMTNLGFKGNANGAVKEAIDAGVIVKLPSGKFILKGHGNKQTLPLPGEAGPIVSTAQAQPSIGVEAIRRQFSVDHPIQHMAAHHAQRFAELLNYMLDSADTDTTPVADRTIGSTVTHLAKRTHESVQDIVLQGTQAWASSAHDNQYTAMLCDTLEQMGMSTNNPYPGAPTMKSGNAEWDEISSSSVKNTLTAMGVPNANSYRTRDYAGHTYYTDPDDPDAPMFMTIKGTSDAQKYGAKQVNGNIAKIISRAELVLQEYAATQAAFTHNNLTHMSIFRGVREKVYDLMRAEASKRQGLGAHLGQRQLAGWSSNESTAKSFSHGWLVFHEESMPVHQIFLHYAQKIHSEDVFSSLSHESGGGGEREILVIGHHTVTQEPIMKGSTVKLAKQARKAQLERERVSIMPPPLVDPDIPEGFGRWVTNPDGIHYFVTNKSVKVLFLLSSVDTPTDEAAENLSPKQASFDLSVADVVGGMVQS